MSAAVTLVLGGARSGKSAWAEQQARRHPGGVLFLATATASDPEMAARIAAHRAARPAAWRTAEEPLALAEAVRREARPGDLVLVDCLTLWLGGFLLARAGTDPDALEPAAWAAIEAAAAAEAIEVVEAARARAAPLLIVSNEVGMGLVPPYPLGRAYRDALGRVNREVAAAAESVVLMIAGLPVDLRRLLVEGTP